MFNYFTIINFIKLFLINIFFDFLPVINSSLLRSFAYCDHRFLLTVHRSAILNLTIRFLTRFTSINLHFKTLIYKLPFSNLRLQTLILTFAKIKFWKTDKTTIQTHYGNMGNILPWFSRCCSSLGFPFGADISWICTSKQVPMFWF